MEPQKNDFVDIKPVACVIAYRNQTMGAFYKNLLNRRRDCELGPLVSPGEGLTCPDVQDAQVRNLHQIYGLLIFRIDRCQIFAAYCIDSSYSFIQLFPFNTSRGRVPSGGPTIPSFSMMSIRCAARP